MAYHTLLSENDRVGNKVRTGMQKQDSILECKGIGEKNAQYFQRLGIETVGDLLRHYPERYDSFGDIIRIGDGENGKTAAVQVVLVSAPVIKRPGRLPLLSVCGEDGNGRITLTWFHMPYLKNTLKKGQTYIFRGKILRDSHGIHMEQPQIFSPSAYEGLKSTLQPVYSTVKGLSVKLISKTMAQALDLLELSPEFLPDALRAKYQLAEWNYAIRTIHFPSDQEELLFARKRLVFDEFLLFILALRRLKERKEERPNTFFIPKGQLSQKIRQGLPYELTAAQQRVLAEINQDLIGKKMMNRLIQGDVGSGKTILAMLALVDTAEQGYQGALMAPTEVLARQHLESFQEIFARYDIPLRLELLTGSLTAAEKRRACQRIANHEVDIVIGTHALIQERVIYDRLALVITDEQHRFGVRQRESLSEKGKEPHILVMSATPIPRTLAIILYGDLDISVVDELPAQRLPIKNCVVDTSYRPKAYDFIRREIQAGRQAYVICPMVEESEGLDAENVIDYTEKLREALPPAIQIEYLHGKMKPKEKNDRMERFLRGEIQILVSTTVVEVGVNVPNATVMMIENAERFGLAQLHQLRGRVGRGKYQSYCIFMDNSGDGEIHKRLEVLNHSNDGFQIASEDLKLRGPGDVFGIRQSGSLRFSIGDIFTDSRILQQAAEAADAIMEEDPELLSEDYLPLKRRLATFDRDTRDKLGTL